MAKCRKADQKRIQLKTTEDSGRLELTARGFRAAQHRPSLQAFRTLVRRVVFRHPIGEYRYARGQSAQSPCNMKSTGGLNHRHKQRAISWIILEGIYLFFCLLLLLDSKQPVLQIFFAGLIEDSQRFCWQFKPCASEIFLHMFGRFGAS